MHLCVCRYRSLTWHLIYSSTLLTHGIGVTQELFSSACLGRQPSRGTPGSYSLVLRLQMAAILTQLYYMVSGDLSFSPHVCSNHPVLPEKFSQLFLHVQIISSNLLSHFASHCMPSLLHFCFWKFSPIIFNNAIFSPVPPTKALPLSYQYPVLLWWGPSFFRWPSSWALLRMPLSPPHTSLPKHWTTSLHLFVVCLKHPHSKCLLSVFSWLNFDILRT